MFQIYFKSIQEQYLSDKESTEHTYRTPLENLLNIFEKEITKRNLKVKHEPKKQDDKGRPDFKVTTQEQLTIGFIETKKIGEDLKKILDSKQLIRYKQLSDNIIVTDYIQFYLIKKGIRVFDFSLFSEYNLENKRFKLEKSNIDGLTRLLKEFFESEPETIYKTQDLALKLSEKAKFLREYCYAELEKENDDTNLLQGLFNAFRDTLLPLLDTQYFADIYAQTLTYGLFLAALNCDDPKTQLNKDTAHKLLPTTFPLIRELFHSLEDFPSEIVWSVDEIITILKVTDFTSIKKEFAEYRNKGQGFNDPFIFFYEDFLKHYDKSQRELRGVYYTPEPVVSFIVRSIEVILKETFGINDGFINKDVTLLDFATGTGTFLLHSFKLAIEQVQKIGDKQTVNKILNEQVINNFYGFELLVAPYVIAHLKISEYLKEQGYSIEKGKRLNIYLTNTLTNNVPHPLPLMPLLSREGKEANRIKNKDILIILGNPPYSGHSANKGDWIQEEIKEYYQIDGKPLGEKNPKWLQDDYVKFIRFAQWKMDKVERGIVGIITNHSWLDNPTFRGMRQSLMKSFDEIYILDLHGNTKKKEKCSDGSKDENVFDIQQGVSISLFIKKNNLSKNCKIFCYDLFGLRVNKYLELYENDIHSINWSTIIPNSNIYYFKKINGVRELYKKFFSVTEIFNKYSVGILTHRDNFSISISKKKINERIEELFNPRINPFDIIIKYSLNEDFIKNIEILRNQFKKSDIFESIANINYRVFDIRKILYHNKLVDRQREIVNKYLTKNNLSLICQRQTYGLDFHHVFITNLISDLNIMSNLGGGTVFPIYTYNETDLNDSNGNGFLFNEEGKKDNFTKDFRKYIKTKYKETYTPEQILGYIYAVLHSPSYRTKYIEFLKIDFPRVPFTDNEEKFKELLEIGKELIEHHLLNKNYTDSICKFIGDSENFKVEKVEYDKGKVWINKERYFESVPVEIWNFYIGGYQVLDKWLKERKKHGITLSSDDFQHFIKVVNVLDITIKTMQKIDDLTKEWI